MPHPHPTAPCTLRRSAQGRSPVWQIDRLLEHRSSLKLPRAVVQLWLLPGACLWSQPHKLPQLPMCEHLWRRQWHPHKLPLLHQFFGLDCTFDGQCARQIDLFRLIDGCTSFKERNNHEQPCNVLKLLLLPSFWAKCHQLDQMNPLRQVFEGQGYLQAMKWLPQVKTISAAAESAEAVHTSILHPENHCTSMEDK